MTLTANSPARRALALAALLAPLAALALLMPEVAAAQNPLEEGARNALSTAQIVLGAVFTILLGFVAIRLFAQRNFGGLAVTLLVAGVVAWVVFNPEGAGNTLEDIGNALFG